MTIEEFFALIWGQGTGLVVSKTNNGWKHKKCATIGEAAALAKRLDGAGAPVYHSCGLYESTPRTQENVKSLRSFWLDIDCGEAKGYPTQANALAALGQFVDELGLPSPYIINSGAGLHIYWPLDTNIRKEQWQPVADMLKEACKQQGLNADPSRTADASSILRPVGTTNNKHGKPVTVLKEGEVTSYARLVNCLSTYTGHLGAPPAHITIQPDNDIPDQPDTQYEPVYVADIISGCGALRAFSETHEQLSEPKWRAGLGILSRCEDGREHAHEWSARDARYSEQQTQAKLDSWPKPVTCKHVSEHWDECKTCPFFGKIKTPLQIGKSVPIEVDEVDEDGVSIPLPAIPKDYRIMQKNDVYNLYQSTGDPDTPWKPIYPAIIYVDSYYEEADIVYMVIHERGKHGLKEARVQMGNFANNDWKKPLYNARMMINDSNSKNLKAYFAAWSTDQNLLPPSVTAHENMGWHGGELVVGERKYKSDGTYETIRLNSSIHEYSKGLEPVGSLDKWVEITDKLFNQDGLEHFQFMIMCSFASPLLNLMGDEGSVLVYAHSSDGGYGKTTAERAALSVWGTWKERSRSLASTTDNAFLTMLSAMSHLPIIYDELTNYDDKKLSQFVHNISSGKPKARLDRNGRQRSMPNTWDLIVCASGNQLLSDKLSLNKSNASAELSRIFEYTFPKLKSNVTPTEATILMKELESHVGTAGEVYARYLAVNRAKIKVAVNNVLKSLGIKHKFQGIDRYYARLMAAVIVATKIANALKLVAFDRQKIEDFMLDSIGHQRETIKEVSTDPVPKFQEMLGELMPNILVTVGDEKWIASGGEVLVKQHPRGSIAGWFLTAPIAEHRIGMKQLQRTIPEFWLMETAVKTWCSKRGLDYKHMLKEWDNAGLIRGGAKRNRRIGRGLEEYSTMKATMIELDNKSAVASVTPLTATAVPAI